MNVFVTGAAGYAGHHTAIALRAAGHQVFGLVRDGNGGRAKELHKHEVHTVVGNLRQPDTYQNFLDNSDAIVHTVMDHQDPQGTDNTLFDALAAAAIGSPRKRLFVYTTGCSIYGKVPPRVMDESTPGNPKHALYFRMEMEKKVLALPGYRKMIVRPGFMYGKDGHSSMSAQWFAMGEAGTVVYHGDVDKGWSWVHVSDLAEAFVRIVDTGGIGLDGEIFCLADEQRPKCLDVMTACVRAAGFQGEIKTAPPDPSDWSSTVFDQNEFITSQKARRLLGWAARHTGILDDIDTYYAAWEAAQLASRK